MNFSTHPIDAGNNNEMLKAFDIFPPFFALFASAGFLADWRAFILGHNYNADQSRFLRVVQSVFLQRRKLELADLYEQPFTKFDANAVEKLIGERGITELIEFTPKCFCSGLTKRLAA